MFQLPIWFTNFKNYESAIGDRAIELAQIHQRIADETGASIGIIVNAFDLYRVAHAVTIPVFAQHIDPIDYGKATGHLLPQSAKRSGAMGTLLNHSEKRMDPEDIENACALAQKTSLARIICAENPEEIEKFVHLRPDFLAFEPPELIGSTGASVANTKPDSIAKSVQVSAGIPVLVGAGINSAKDVEVSLNLGAKGFLVATAITRAPDPEKALKEFISAF